VYQNLFKTYAHVTGNARMLHPLWIGHNIPESQPECFSPSVYRYRTVLRRLFDTQRSTERSGVAFDRHIQYFYNAALLLLDQLTTTRGTLIVSPPGSGMSEILVVSILTHLYVDFEETSASSQTLPKTSSSHPSPTPTPPSPPPEPHSLAPMAIVVHGTDAGRSRFHRLMLRISTQYHARHSSFAGSPHESFVVGNELEQFLALFSVQYPQQKMPIIYIDDARTLTRVQWVYVCELWRCGLRVVITGIHDTVVGDMSLMELFHTSPVYGINEDRIQCVHQQLRMHNERRGGITRITTFLFNEPARTAFIAHTQPMSDATHTPTCVDGQPVDTCINAITIDPSDDSVVPYGTRVTHFSAYFHNTNIRIMASGFVCQSKVILPDTDQKCRDLIRELKQRHWLPSKPPSAPLFELEQTRECAQRTALRMCVAKRAGVLESKSMAYRQGLLQDVSCHMLALFI
jgi:hypothetical protein